MRKVNKIIYLTAILLIMGVFLSGCAKKEENQEEAMQKLKVGDTGEYKYEGVTFTYEIKSNGAYIKDVSPDKGEKLVFPQKIGEFTVYDVNSFLVLKFKEIKFNGIQSSPTGNTRRRTLGWRYGIYGI